MVPTSAGNDTNSLGRQAGSDSAYCPVRAVLILLSARWTLQIVHSLLAGPKRFNEIAREISVNPRTLCERLRSLEESDVISRHVISEMPPNVEYSLTEKGMSLREIVEELAEWGRQWMASPCPNVE